MGLLGSIGSALGGIGDVVKGATSIFGGGNKQQQPDKKQIYQQQVATMANPSPFGGQSGMQRTMAPQMQQGGQNEDLLSSLARILGGGSGLLKSAPSLVDPLKAAAGLPAAGIGPAGPASLGANESYAMGLPGLQEALGGAAGQSGTASALSQIATSPGFWASIAPFLL